MKRGPRRVKDQTVQRETARRIVRKTLLALTQTRYGKNALEASGGSERICLIRIEQLPAQGAREAKREMAGQRGGEARELLHSAARYNA